MNELGENLVLPSFTRSTLPDPRAFANKVVVIVEPSGNRMSHFSDGLAWWPMLKGQVDSTGRVSGLVGSDGVLVPILSGVAGLSTSASSAAANTAALNASLALGGKVTLTGINRFYVNSTIYVPSYTEFVIDKGVELYLADNSNCALIANKNAFNLGVAIGSAINWVGNAPDYSATVVKTGIGNTYPVGSWIGILNLTSAANDQVFQGVWQVTAVTTTTTTNDTIRFSMTQQPVGGGNSTSGGFIYPADSFIKISGGGILNGNGANQNPSFSIYFQGDPRTCGTWFRNVKTLVVDGPIVKKANSWGIASNNITDYEVLNIDGDAYSATVGSNDTVHLAGQHRRALIRNIKGSTNDNVVGLTIDKASTIVNSYSQFYSPGDMHQISIQNISCYDNATGVATVAMYGPTDYFYHSVYIDGVKGKATGAAVQVAAYAPTAMLGCSGGILDIRNVDANAVSNSITLGGDGTWDSITIDGVRNETTNGIVAPMISALNSGNAIQTIKQLKISRLSSPLVSGTARSANLIDISGSNITNLDVSDIEGMAFSAAVSMVGISGATGSVGKVSVDKCSMTTTSAVAASLVGVTGAIPVSSINCVNSRFTGTTSVGSMVSLGATAVVGAATFAPSCDTVAAAGLIACTTVGRLNGANAQLDGAKITAPVSGDVFYNTTATLGGIGVNMRGASTWTRIAA